MAKRRPLDLHKLALIDVSLEDDDLLPSSSAYPHMLIASPLLNRTHQQHAYSPGLQPSKAYDELTVIHEESPESQSSGNPASTSRGAGMQTEIHPVLSEEPVLPNRKKRSAQFNLRKSLAWNNAFFTDEGVLDPEELSLVNKTFKKPPHMPKAEINKKGVRNNRAERCRPESTLNFFDKSAFSGHKQRMDLDFSPYAQRIEIINGNSLQRSSSSISSACSSTGSITGCGSERLEQHGSKDKTSVPCLQTQSEVGRHLTDNIKPVLTMALGSLPSKGAYSPKVVDTGSEKGSRLRLPSSFSYPQINTAKRSAGRSTVELQKAVAKQNKEAIATLKSSPSSISNLTKKVSSVSRKMKDKLGKVLPSHNNHKGTTMSVQDDSHIATSSPTSLDSNVAESTNLTRCYSYTPFERFGKNLYDAVSELASNNSGSYSEPTPMECQYNHDYNLEGAADRLNSLSSPACSSADLNGKHHSLGNGVIDASQSTVKLRHQDLRGKDAAIQKTFQITDSLSSQKICSKEAGNLGSDLSHSARPSGLRKPSPKLGFFNQARGTPVPQLPTLLERSKGVILDGKCGHTGKQTILSRFANDGMGTNNTNQHSMKPKYQGLSLNRVGHRASEISGLSVRGCPTSSSIPSAPHLCWPEKVSKSSMQSASASVVQFGLSSAKAVSGQGCNSSGVAGSEKGPHSLDAKKDQGCNSARVVSCAKRPFTRNVVSATKVGPGSVSIVDAKRVGRQSSTDSSDSCRNRLLYQNSDSSCGGTLISNSGEFTRSIDHQCCLDKGRVDARESSSIGIPEITRMEDSGTGEIRDMAPQNGNDLFRSQDSRCFTNDSSLKGIPVQSFDTSGPRTQLDDPHHDIVTSLASQSRKDDILVEVSKSVPTLGTGKSLLLNSLGKFGESVDCAPQWSDREAFEAVPSASQSTVSSPANFFQHGSNYLVSKTGDVSSPRVASHELSIRSPLGSNAVNVGERHVLNHLKKEKGSFFSFAKKAVSRLTLSPSREHSGQENSCAEWQGGGFGFHKLSRSKSARMQQSSIEKNDLLAISNVSPFSEERICALETAGEEMLQKKTGPVKHSPPDKTSPEAGPWSPVCRLVLP